MSSGQEQTAEGKKKPHAPHGAPHLGAHEPHEGAPEWLISFADNVTLMMGFFVILLAMNMKVAVEAVGGGQEGEGSPAKIAALDLAIGIREAFNNPVNVHSYAPEDLPLVRRLIERGGDSAARTRGPKGREHDVRSIRPGQYSSHGGTVFFEQASSLLDEPARETLSFIAGQTRGLNLVVAVRGHVSAAESFGSPDRGMKMSYDRALAVATFLSEAGVGWERLRITACADNDRLVAAAYEPDSHRSNQRVEISVTDELPILDAPPSMAIPKEHDPGS